MSFSTVFRQSLPHGLCVGVKLPAPRPHELSLDSSVLDRLAPEERAFAAALGPGRQLTWIGGRLAARAALTDLALEAGPLLATDRGAPLFPSGARGSISHKQSLAVALVDNDERWTIGVDVEQAAGSSYDIASRVLSPRERQNLATLSEAERAREVIFAFSAKEALYKALDPHVRRYVAFDEVSVVRDAAGQAYFELDLQQGEGPFATELDIWSWEQMLIVTARVRPLTAS